MSYEQDDDASQIRGLKETNASLQAQILALQASSVTLENIDSGQNTFPGANPSARGGGGSEPIPVGTTENDHLEWDNTALNWFAVQNMTHGTTGPFADSGFNRFANDTIMLSTRNILNDGNLELKIDSADFFDFTESNNGIVGIKLRAQHASDPDNTLTLTQFSGLTGQAELFSPNRFHFYGSGFSEVFNFDEIRILSKVPINMDKNIINTIGQTQYDRTIGFTPAAANAIGFDNVNNFLKYNVGLTTDAHAWYAAGELLSSLTRVAANSGQLNIDNVVADDLLQTNKQLFLSSAATPSPLFNGAIWRDSGDGKFKFRQNGVTEELGGGAADNLGNHIATMFLNMAEYNIQWDTTGYDHKIIPNTDSLTVELGGEGDSLILKNPDASTLPFSAVFNSGIFNMENASAGGSTPVSFQVTRNNAGTPADGDVITKIEFRGNEDDGGATPWPVVTYAELETSVNDVSSPEGRMMLRIKSVGTFDDVIDINPNLASGPPYFALLSGYQLQMSGSNIINSGAHEFEDITGSTSSKKSIYTLNNEMVINTTLTDSVKLKVAGVDKLAVDTSGATFSGIIHQTSAVHYLEQDDRSSDPAAPTDGGRWYTKDVAGVSTPFFIGNGKAAVDLSAGAGGVAFPIEPDVTDNGDTWTGTQTLNLSTGDGHVFKWIVDQNLTFATTVSNVPTSGTQRTFELEFVHDEIGGTFTVTLPTSPAFVDENGNSLASFDIASGRAILSCRVNEGSGGNIIVLQKNVSAVSVVNAAHTLDFHDDVSFGTPAVKDYLRHNGTVWQDSPILLADLALADTKIIVGGATGVGAEQTVSGDATLANTGALTIANDAITLAKMAHGTANKFIGFDGSGVPVEKDGISPLTTKGDLFAYSTVDARFPIGLTDGHVLVVDSAQPFGMKWAAAGAADNLGNHQATMLLDMKTFNIDNVGSLISNATTPATNGAIRLGNTEKIFWRDAGNTSNIGFEVNASDRIVASGPLIASNSSTPLGVSSARWGTAWVSAIDNVGTLQVGGIATFDDDVTLGNADTDNVVLRGNVNRDIKFNLGKTVNFNGSQSTVGSAGFADAVPTKPTTWVKIKNAGTEYVIPAFAVS